MFYLWYFYTNTEHVLLGSFCHGLPCHNAHRNDGIRDGKYKLGICALLNPSVSEVLAFQLLLIKLCIFRDCSHAVSPHWSNVGVRNTVKDSPESEAPLRWV